MNFVNQIIDKYIDKYRCTVEYCIDNNLDTDLEIKEFNDFYINEYGAQSAYLLFDIAQKTMRLETDSIRLKMLLESKGIY